MCVGACSNFVLRSGVGLLSVCQFQLVSVPSREKGKHIILMYTDLLRDYSVLVSESTNLNWNTTIHCTWAGWHASVHLRYCIRNPHMIFWQWAFTLYNTIHFLPKHFSWDLSTSCPTTPPSLPSQHLLQVKLVIPQEIVMMMLMIRVPLLACESQVSLYLFLQNI